MGGGKDRSKREMHGNSLHNLHPRQKLKPGYASLNVRFYVHADVAALMGRLSAEERGRVLEGGVKSVLEAE